MPEDGLAGKFGWCHPAQANYIGRPHRRPRGGACENQGRRRMSGERRRAKWMDVPLALALWLLMAQTGDTEAIKIDPTDPDVFNNRGQAYDAQGESDSAIADYSESIRLNRDNPRAFFNRGLAYANKSEYQRAVADFNAAIKLDPRDAEAYVSRGAVHEELGNETAARADYRNALELVPDHEDAKAALARR